jgi:hypothetical protein
MIYAKIVNGIVVNTQVIEEGDSLDPAFTWVNITNLEPQPGRDWTYDGETFAPPQGA